jgi:hypothetical protein
MIFPPYGSFDWEAGNASPGVSLVGSLPVESSGDPSCVVSSSLAVMPEARSLSSHKTDISFSLPLHAQRILFAHSQSRNDLPDIIRVRSANSGPITLIDYGSDRTTISLPVGIKRCPRVLQNNKRVPSPDQRNAILSAGNAASWPESTNEVRRYYRERCPFLGYTWPGHVRRGARRVPPLRRLLSKGPRHELEAAGLACKGSLPAGPPRPALVA